MAPKCGCHNRFSLINMLVFLGYFSLRFMVIFCSSSSPDISGDLDHLKLLQIVMRHGARNPNFFYPKDPHKNYNFIGGAGQLTNSGKLQQYQFGKVLKERYSNFLTSNPKEVYARSSALDRTVESAMATLAGMYPPEGDWVWNKCLEWQPIPVYTIPEKDDYLLHYNPPCPAFMREYKEFTRTEMFKSYDRHYQDFFKFLSDKTGMDVKEWYQVIFINSMIEIEMQHNLPPPSWATEEVLGKLKTTAGLAFRFLYNTTRLQRLRGGPLIADMINNIEKKLNGSLEQKKLFLYSTHDAVLAAFMNALQAYNDMVPPFSAAIIVELHSLTSGDFVRFFYANSSKLEYYRQELNILKIPGCTPFCSVETFLNITKNVIPIDWKEECL